MFFRTFNPKTLRASRMVDGTAAAACLLNSLKLQHGGILVAQRHATASSSMSISQVSVQRRLVSSSKIRPRVVNALQEEEEAAEDDPPLRRGDALSQQQQQQGRKLHRRKDADDDNEDGDGVDWERSDLESTENLVDLGEQEGGEEEWLQPTVRGESGAEELDGSVEEDESDDQLTSTGNERIRKGEQQVEDEDEIDEEEREDDTAAKEIHVDDRLLTERFPEYAEEYDSCNDIPVEKILVDSAKVVTWNCSECLTQWPCAVFIRCTLRTKCPTCTDSKTSALAMYPGVVDRWDQARNDPLVDPMQLPANSKTKAFWLCSVCNNSFKESASTAVAKRVICPQCRLTRTAHHALSREFLMREWHPLKNGDLDPSSVQDTDKTKVWWLCSACGEEWNTTFYNRRSSRRMNKGKYCPACRNLALLET